MSMQAAIEGFSLSAGLITAIGAQNTLVLRQGLIRAHLFPVVAFCTLTDMVLITCGAIGLEPLIKSLPYLTPSITLGGTAFLAWYGFMAARRALTPSVLLPIEEPIQPLGQLLLTVAAVTLLNPHVYLDTIVLLGSVSARYPFDERIWFVFGAILASLTWFCSLGYGARFLTPLFRKPTAWRVLDSLATLIMWTIAFSLGMESLHTIIRS